MSVQTEQDLRSALAALGRSKRRAFVVSLAERRDASQDPQMAAVWAMLAAMAAEVADDETAVLRELAFEVPDFLGEDPPPAA